MKWTKLIAGDEFYRPRQSQGTEMKRTPFNQVLHLELHTGDLSGAGALYEELCGWRRERIDTRHGSYVALELGRGIGGGIVECPVERPMWLPYVNVPDIGAATDHARVLGASVLLEPREGPAGWRSVVATGAGGQIAFWQSKT
jgi:predicted enzyme related to lactoylglutathione lyase